ncbi:MAG: MFS transporter [Oscillospiraceae bacterium]|nr:MFS transporter [Oscillospiraceae bacterium]
MKKLSLKVDGRFYYGWVMLLCGFMSMFICYVIKVNCQSLFYNPICEELGVTRTAYIQTNTIMTVTMLIGSMFIGKLYKKFPIKFVLTGCVVLTSICYLLMSRATALWQLYLLAGIQGFGWSGATNLPATIMVGNWFGPKVKGTALSIAMLGSGAGALVWVKLINSVIVNSGWRSAYLAMAGVNAIMIPIALLLVVSMPADKGFETRIGDPSPEEVAAAGGVSTQKTGITGAQALKTGRWWLQWFAGMITMIGAAAFSAQFVAHFTEVTGDSNLAATLYASALGTMILGKFLVGVLSDIIHIKRMAVITPLFYAGVFLCMALSTGNMVFSKILIPLYLIGGALPSTIPFLITARNFGDKEYGVLSGWMNMAGNVGQIIGPTVAALIFDITGAYKVAWIVFTILMVVVSVLYGLSSMVSKKQIEAMGYHPS